jgi:hypothetical protein
MELSRFGGNTSETYPIWRKCTCVDVTNYGGNAPAWMLPSMVEMRLTLNVMLFTSKLHTRRHTQPPFKPAAFRMQVLERYFNISDIN